MLSNQELEQLLSDLESDRAERKESIGDKDKIRQAICALANDLPNYNLPGVIFVGAKDDGGCADLPVTDRLLQTLADMRDDGKTLPFPSMTVQKKKINGCELVVIEVSPSFTPPVRYNGRVWIRVGPRRAQATAEEERRLTEKRRSGDLTYDQRPVLGVTLEDLDVEFFQKVYLPSAISHETLVQNNRTLAQQMMSLRFLSPDGMPNAAALLIFGKDTIRWIPSAYIQFLRLDGAGLTDPIRHQKEVAGPIPGALHQLDEILDANISVATDVRSGLTELKQPDYPIVALRQFAYNAVMHRAYENTNAPVKIYWFSDRIEIYSPGGLYGQMTPANFGKGITDYRNPLLAEALKVLGYVQRFGMGIPLAEEELKKNGNPAPEYRFEPTGILTIVRKRS